MIANYLVSKGYTVYGTSRSPKNIENYSFQLIKLEITKTFSIKNVIQKVIEKEGRIDVLINNAGKGIAGSIEDTPTDNMRLVFDTNLFGAIEMIKEVLPFMREKKSGLIINITSISGFMGQPFRGIYCAAKGALELITESLSMEVKKYGIKAVNIVPCDFILNATSGQGKRTLFFRFIFLISSCLYH